MERVGGDGRVPSELTTQALLLSVCLCVWYVVVVIVVVVVRMLRLRTMSEDDSA